MWTGSRFFNQEETNIAETDQDELITRGVGGRFIVPPTKEKYPSGSLLFAQRTM